MKTIHLFSVNRNSDQTEGRGHSIPVVYTLSEKVAKQIATNPIFYKQHGVQGCCDGDWAVQKTEFPVVESLADYLTYTQNEKAKKALAKLSDEEKELLGLK